MVPTRRRALRALGVGAVAALAGCNGLESSPQAEEFTLVLHEIETPLVEYVLFEPSDGDLFGDPQRAALDSIFSEGSATTYGYTPLPDGGYVERDGTYYELERAVTGRRTTDRTVVRASDVEESEIPDDAVALDSLPRPSARAVKILHSAIQRGSPPETPNMRRDGGYVLRRPAELDARIAGELDGRVVVIQPGGSWALELDIGTEWVSEAEYTATARAVADSTAAFREVARADRLDTYLPDYSLSDGAKERLDRAWVGDGYSEETPLSEPYRELLTVLGFDDETANGRLLETETGLFRYGLYVNEAE